MIGSGRSIRGAPRGGSAPSPQNNAPRGTPSAAAQNVLRGLLRIVTPVVNLVNRVVQGMTGGRGGIAQLARGLTGLVNQAYHRATGQAWRAQSGTGGGTSGAAGDEGTGEEDTPALPPPTPDIGESNDRLRALNEEEEETRPFNWNEFFGDDFTLEDIGDSVRESAERFLTFVRGEVDDDVPLLAQIRTLFERVGVTMTEMFTVDPVNENLSFAGIEWINNYLAAPQVLTDMGAAEYAITQIAANADHFDVELGEIEGMTTEEVVNRYLQLLRDREAHATEWGVSLLGLSDEVAQIELFQRTFGVSNEITLDMFRWANDQELHVDYSNPEGLESAIRSYLTEEINIYAPNPAGVDLDSLSLRELTDFHYMTVLGAYDAALDEMQAIPNWQLYSNYISAQERQSTNWMDPILLTGIARSEIRLAEGSFDSDRAVLIEQYRYHLEGMGEDVRGVQGVLSAFERNYVSEPPDLTLLRIVLSFWEPADYALTIPEIGRDLAEGNLGSALENAALLILPGLSGWMNDAARAGSASGDVVFSTTGPDDRRLISGGLNDDLIPGSPEHMAQRWREYQSNPDNAGWTYERWRRNYELNQTRALDAQREVEAYAESLGWGSTSQISLNLPELGGRRLDIIDRESRRGIEYKGGNYFYRDPDIMLELAKDKALVVRGWTIEWVF